MKMSRADGQIKDSVNNTLINPKDASRQRKNIVDFLVKSNIEFEQKQPDVYEARIQIKSPRLQRSNQSLKVDDKNLDQIQSNLKKSGDQLITDLIKLADLSKNDNQNVNFLTNPEAYLSSSSTEIQLYEDLAFEEDVFYGNGVGDFFLIFLKLQIKKLLEQRKLIFQHLLKDRSQEQQKQNSLRLIETTLRMTATIVHIHKQSNKYKFKPFVEQLLYERVEPLLQFVLFIWESKIPRLNFGQQLQLETCDEQLVCNMDCLFDLYEKIFDKLGFFLSENSKSQNYQDPQIEIQTSKLLIQAIKTLFNQNEFEDILIKLDKYNLIKISPRSKILTQKIQNEERKQFKFIHLKEIQSKSKKIGGAAKINNSPPRTIHQSQRKSLQILNFNQPTSTNLNKNLNEKRLNKQGQRNISPISNSIFTNSYKSTTGSHSTKISSPKSGSPQAFERFSHLNPEISQLNQSSLLNYSCFEQYSKNKRNISSENFIEQNQKQQIVKVSNTSESPRFNQKPILKDINTSNKLIVTQFVAENSPNSQATTQKKNPGFIESSNFLSSKFDLGILQENENFTFRNNNGHKNITNNTKNPTVNKEAYNKSSDQGVVSQQAQKFIKILSNNSSIYQQDQDYFSYKSRISVKNTTQNVKTDSSWSPKSLQIQHQNENQHQSTQNKCASGKPIEFFPSNKNQIIQNQFKLVNRASMSPNSKTRNKLSIKYQDVIEKEFKKFDQKKNVNFSPVVIEKQYEKSIASLYERLDLLSSEELLSYYEFIISKARMLFVNFLKQKGVI